MALTRSRQGVDYLEQLQRQEYESTGTSRQAERDPEIMRDVAARQLIQEWLDEHPASSTEDMIELVGDPAHLAAVDVRTADLQEYYVGADGDIWSALERPDQRRLLSELVRSVEAAALARGHEIPRRPVVGTLPSGDIQAQARPGPPGEGHLVILETGIFGFSSLVTSAAVRGSRTALGPGGELPGIPDKRAVAAQVVNEPPIWLQFADLLFSQAGLGSCQYATQHGMPQHFRSFAQVLGTGLNSFVLAHEYAHLILGHTDAAQQRGDELYWAQDDEIDADALALEITADACGLVAAYAGATLFLTGVEYVERAHGLLRTGEASAPPSTAHPAPGERKAMLWSALQRAGDQQEIDYSARLGIALYAALTALWTIVEPAFEAGHRLGLPPLGWKPAIEIEHDAMLSHLLLEGSVIDTRLLGLPPTQ